MAWAHAVSMAVVPLTAVSLAVAAWALSVGVDAPTARWLALCLVMSLPPLVLGQLITHRLPRNGVGALLGCAGLIILAVGCFDTYVAAAEQSNSLPLNGLWISFSQGAWMLLYLPWALLLLVFPAGTLGDKSARLLASGLLTVTVAFGVLAALSPEPYEDSFQQQHRALGSVPGADIAAVALLPIFLALLVFSALHQGRRFRRADPAVRNQIRWLALGGVSIPATLLLCWVGYLVNRNENIVMIGLAVMYLLIPSAIALAILREDLFDAGRVLVSALGVLAVLGAVAILAVVLVSWPGIESRPGLTLVAAGTAVGTLALAALRPRIQHVIGRIVYAEHERLLDAVKAFENRVFGNEARPAELEGILRSVSADPALRIAYARSSGEGFCDAQGAALEAGSGIPVSLAGHLSGVIIPGPGHGRVFNAETTRALALMLEMGRQQVELSAALAEIDASRTRLLLASLAERKRLERDLHDGAQQRLVALGMELRLMQRRLPANGQGLAAQLDAAVAELATAVAELRQIAHGIRPSALDEGLEAALRQLSGRSPTPVLLQIDGQLADVPEVVGATAYFVAAEAVHNAIRHAAAQRITVQLELAGTRIRLRVSDDGRGGAASTPGGGLAGLDDRVNALGGALHVSSTTGRGTTIEAVLPCVW